MSGILLNTTYNRAERYSREGDENVNNMLVTHAYTLFLYYYKT